MSNLLKYLKHTLLIGVATISLIGCGVSNNVTFQTTNGVCPTNESGAPYCMSVQIQNNGGGQNWINSTNFPISNLSMAITGANNVQSPATNKTTYDPNNCTGSTISPGGTCTFYLQISTESYPVNSQESIQITLNYTINNTLFGGSTTTATSNLTVFELTALYTMQSNGNLWAYSNAWNNYGIIESADVANAMTLDTSSYGLLYIGGQLGIYAYALSNNTISTSISSGNITGANNLFNLSGNLYATNISSSFGTYSYSFSGESWNSSSTPVYNYNFSTNANANTVSPTSITYLANGNQVYSCGGGSSTTTCTTEGSTAGTGSVTSLSMLSGSSSTYTGLYAGTTTGLYAESGTTPSSTSSWTQVTGISPNVTVGSLVSKNGVLYAGDSAGNIWLLSASSPTTAVNFVNVGSTNAVQAMVVDTAGNLLYFAAGNNTGYAIYSCSILATPCTPSVVIPSLIYTNSVVGMGIASLLTNTLNNPANYGAL